METNDEAEVPGRKGHLYSYAQIVFHLAFRYIKLTALPPIIEPMTLGYPRAFTSRLEREHELKGLHVQSIIAAALFLEAYIFDYTARRGSDDLAERLDKMDPPSKFIVATTLLWKTPLSPDTEPYGTIKRLFRVRNRLVHCKSTGDGAVFDMPELPDDLNPERIVECVLDTLGRFANSDSEDELTLLLLRQIMAWLEVAKNDLDFYPIPSNA